MQTLLSPPSSGKMSQLRIFGHCISNSVRIGSQSRLTSSHTLLQLVTACGICSGHMGANALKNRIATTTVQSHSLTCI